MHTALLLGTMDTKGKEYGFVRDALNANGVATVVVDTGILAGPTIRVDYSRDAVAEAAQVDFQELVSRGNRGEAVTAMAKGAATLVARLHGEGRFDGALALGGTGGTAIAAEAFRGLPLGMPKIIVSTAASGDTRAYIGESDLILIPSVTDIAGLNRLSARILSNAAGALTGMLKGSIPSMDISRELVGASMFGVTTTCVNAGRELLEHLGYEVLTFHMTGTGGRTLEHLLATRWMAGVLDVTTTELADELVGGVFSAGSGRLTAAGRLGVPQVVSVGALDMVNFGPKETVPESFSGRNLYVHNPSITLMRTTVEECAELGRRVATRLSAATGPTALFLPLKGISAIAVPGGPFYDPDADAALFDTIRKEVDRDVVELVEIDADVNHPTFSRAMVEKLDTYMRESKLSSI